MNYIRHLNAFFSFVRSDKRLTAFHVSLYMALFQTWNIGRFKNPFTISRDELMRLSAIGSKNTYHKSLKELHDFGYIFYSASLSKFQKSSVYIVVFENSNPVNMQQLNLFVSPGRKNHDQSENTSPNSVHDDKCVGPKYDTVPVPHSVHDEETAGPKYDTVPVPYLTFAGPIFDTVPVPYLGLYIKHKHINSKREREKNSLTQNIFSKNDLLQKGINGFIPRPQNETPMSSFPSLQERG